MRIGIIDDNKIFQQKASDYLATSDSVHLILATESLEKFIHWHRPYFELDLILLNIHLSGNSSVDAIKLLRKEIPNVKFVMLFDNAHNNDLYKTLHSSVIGNLAKEPFPDLEKELNKFFKESNSFFPQISNRIHNYFTLLTKA